MEYISLNNGYTMPTIALNTENLNTQEKVDTFLAEALKIGYRHFDTADVNKNITYIGNFFGKIFAQKIYNRSEIFIGYKIWNTDHFDIHNAVHKFLLDCKLDYVDYLYIHWPVSFVKVTDFVCKDNVLITQKIRPVKVWLELEKMIDCKWARSIGLCNFGPSNFTLIKQYCNFVPSILQLECHPCLLQKEMIKICSMHGTVFVAYTPLGIKFNSSDKLETNRLIKSIAEKYRISPSLLIYSYLRMKNLCVLVNCTSLNDLHENFRLLVLKPKDFDALNSLNIYKRYFDPKNFGDNVFE